MTLARPLDPCGPHPVPAGISPILWRATTRALRILEVNGAGALTRYLATMPNRQVGRLSRSSTLQALPFPDAAFDLASCTRTRSNTCPIRSPRCGGRRVLRPGGGCAFTVPMIV